MKHILTIAAILLLAVGAAAQRLSYSAVVRNSANELVANQNITVAVAIANSNGGEAVYSETHAVTTNQNGLVSLTIGEGTNQTGKLSAVTWPTAFITSTYTLPGNMIVVNTVPANAVPYALYADSAGKAAPMSVTDLLALVGSMTEAEKELLRDALGVSSGDSDEPALFVCGTSKMKDVNGNKYETVQIGTQCWTKTNLRSVPAGAIFGMPGVGSESVPYFYVNGAVDAATCGYYYNWPAAMLACPDGWHLPTDEEWTALMVYVSSQSANICGNNADYIAKALASATGWRPFYSACAIGNNAGTNNATGFSALPAGYFCSDGFSNLGQNANFWSASQKNDGSNYAYYRHFYYQDAYVLDYDYSKDYGYSVRCLKNS